LTPHHEFLFSPGRWIGGGKITFSTSSDLVRFYTSWMIEGIEDSTIRCQQRVEMQALEELINNKFLIYDIHEGKFQMNLENDLIRNACGSGVVDEKTIAWEFRATGGIEGFEVYELQNNGDYLMHAEYSSTKQFRTIIDGRIWRKPI